MWDTELALKIMEQGRQKLPQVWHRAEVVQTTPKLVFSILDGEATFDSETGPLMTRTAASLSWTVGATACALLDGAQLLVLDAM